MICAIRPLPTDRAFLYNSAMKTEYKKRGDRTVDALDRQLFRAGAAQAFLREPLEKLERLPDAGVRGIAADGMRVYYAPGCEVSPEAVAHLLIHCLFRHLLWPENAIHPLWDLACDLSAEFLRAELFPAEDAEATRRLVADALPEGVDPRSAGSVYRALMDLSEDDLEGLYGTFVRDDHRYWYEPRAKDGRRLPYAEYRARVEEGLAELWPSRQAFPDSEALTGRYGLAPGSREERLLNRQPGRYEFSRYQRRFSTLREELRLDQEAFDYIPYCHGLARYGNLPLIEPLEYAESHRVETLVIAIDTSGSCSLPVVERFLSEIEGILMHREYFFSRMNVHIFQCDARIQSCEAIHSLDEWRRYVSHLSIKGRGGTDFRPVFEQVAELRAQGKLKNLKGLLYFTDGDGAYPQQKPPWETAFVFSTRKALQYKIPEWVIPLCLERATGEEWML